MTRDLDLLDLVADPVDLGPLERTNDGWLRNPRRQVAYPVRDGVPVLLREAAVPSPDTTSN